MKRETRLQQVDRCFYSILFKSYGHYLIRGLVRGEVHVCMCSDSTLYDAVNDDNARISNAAKYKCLLILRNSFNNR